MYLEDICIASNPPEKHIDHLRLVLHTLRENQVFIKIPSCLWDRKETEYLGVIEDNGKFIIALDRIAVVRDWLLPGTQRQN